MNTNEALTENGAIHNANEMFKFIIYNKILLTEVLGHNDLYTSFLLPSEPIWINHALRDLQHANDEKHYALMTLFVYWR